MREKTLFDYYEISNILGSVSVPGAVHLQNNKTAAFFYRYLLEKAISVFKWKLPDHWNEDYFTYVLYLAGFVGVIRTDAFGVIPQWGTLAGYNVFYAPARFLYSNPLIGSGDLTIHENCELFKLQGDYLGIADLIGYYSGQMAALAEAVTMNATNSKLSKIFWAGDQASAESFKKMFDKVNNGDPAVIIDKSLKSKSEDAKNPLTWQWFNENLKENYLISDMLSDLRKLENDFCTAVGIPNANTDKRERLITDEVNANNVETSTRAARWLERLQDCAQRVNKMYSLDITVDWRYKPNDEQSIDSRPVQLRSSDI